MQNLGNTIDQVSGSLENLETALHDAGVKDIGIETDLQLQQNLRYLERAHQFIGTMNGQVKASTAKISVIDEQITQLIKERDRIAFSRDFLPSVKSQFARIRETVNTMLYFDRTLGEKL